MMDVSPENDGDTGDNPIPTVPRLDTDPSPMRRINKIYVTTRRASGELHLQSVLQHMDRRLQVLPDLVMFSGTFGLMILSVCVLLVLLSQNMFERQVINLNAQLADTYHWAPYGQSCVLRADGFVPDSCDNRTAAVVPSHIFPIVGAVLGTQWLAELKTAGGALFVTTCVIGGTVDVGWTDLQFLAGYDSYPDCLPTAPQDVAGIAMLESTVRDGEGYYLITLFADLDKRMKQYVYANSDGTSQNLISKVRRIVIAGDGNVGMDAFGGTNNVITSKPLGERYLVTGFCVSVIQELSDAKDKLELTGWSQGKFSALPVVPAWSCGHVVSNASELVAFQAILSVLSLWFFAGDVYITIEGLRGLFTGKPILKYAVLSGLERRKLLLACIVANSMPGLLYMDVSRMYFHSVNGFKLYALSSIMVANFVAFGSLLALSVVDMLVSYVKTFSICVGYSAPVFIVMSIVWMAAAWCNDDNFLDAYNKFYTAPSVIGFWVHDAYYASGSYAPGGTLPIANYLTESILTAVGCSFGVSIAISSLHRWLLHKHWFVSTAWAQSNSLLQKLRLPSFITALPLDPFNAIKIGNTMYCKPSTLALMGYTTVERKKQEMHSVKENDGEEPPQKPHFVVSIYALVPALVLPVSQVRSIGAIMKNQFAHESRKLERKAYRYTRGGCVG
ncbi:hypothetical protein, variant [Aphanomyces invadans]|uniref:Uncharacterized protein n=1 Tax=Aphanomyces invadans TaxID=157072 RepID=A0A024TUB9_9STRA|nr:hypothetical protein, variant [Aphanomyces invadans]ETV97231.1 hypothetical protein, variant [Aphanomyces invadans]|eukprot:XP_008873939.1 hypothetical protein, variant [Aphanomyces invadans]